MNQAFFSRINFDLLREQKQDLLNILDNENNGITQEQTISLEGVISFIDSIQDYAVDDLGYDAEKVFTL